MGKKNKTPKKEASTPSASTPTPVTPPTAPATSPISLTPKRRAPGSPQDLRLRLPAEHDAWFVENSRKGRVSLPALHRAITAEYPSFNFYTSELLYSQFVSKAEEGLTEGEFQELHEHLVENEYCFHELTGGKPLSAGTIEKALRESGHSVSPRTASAIFKYLCSGDVGRSLDGYVELAALITTVDATYARLPSDSIVFDTFLRAVVECLPSRPMAPPLASTAPRAVPLYLSAPLLLLITAITVVMAVAGALDLLDRDHGLA